MKTFSLFYLILGSMLPLFAQKEAPEPSLPPLPPGVLIQLRAPDFAQWVIRAEPATSSASASAATENSGKSPNKETKLKLSWGSVVSVTKTGKIMLRQTMDEKNRVWNTWCIGDLQTTLFPDQKQWVIASRNPDPTVPMANYEDYSQTDFPGFEWISANNYAGIEEIAGKKCILFRDSLQAESKEMLPTAVAAYVDLETRFPVALNKGGDARTYEFMAAPTTPLALPQLVQALLDNRRKNILSATRRSTNSY